MTRKDPSVDAGFDRRSLIKTLGLGGLALAGGAAGASTGSASGSRPTTSVLGATRGGVALVTGPVRSFEVTAGERLGVAIAVAGAPGRGRLPVVRDVAAAELSGLGALASDPGVVRGAYRLMGGFDAPRPLELYGFSAEVTTDLAGGEPVELTWQALVRGAAGDAELRQYLEGFHALVIGRLGEGSLFAGQLSYVEINRVS